MKKKTTTYIRFDILRVSSDPGERINFFKKETETCQEFHTAPKKAKKKKKEICEICAAQRVHYNVDEKSA